MTQLTERAWPAVIVFDLPETQEVVGWIVWVDGLRPKANGDGPELFTDHAEALAARRLLDVVSPVTQARYNELACRFDGGR